MRRIAALSLLLVGCQNSGELVYDEKLTELIKEEWQAAGRHECPGQLAPYYRVTRQELYEQCDGEGDYDACHRSGDIYVSNDIETPRELAYVLIHEYIHYLLWCTFQDTDPGHEQIELWCAHDWSKVNSSCLLGRVMERRKL